jgi:uncharacterized caspase-like protein
MHRDIEFGSLLRRFEPQAGRSVIAVVGINDYAAWPRLENAVGDAIGISRLFQRLGFVELTVPLLNRAATGESMRRLVTDDLAQLSHNDSLVLFFAGHGYSHMASVGEVSVTTGCVIPVDAAGRAGHMSASWLRLDSWLSDIARLRPRHILVIIDACHSGVALSGLHSSRGYRGSGVRWRGAEAAADVDALQARRSRRIITSALDNQRAMDSGPVPGHSLFTGCLIEGLSGRLAEGWQRIVTGTEVGLYLQKRVTAYSLSTQTPDFGPFELDDRGEIVVPILWDDAPAGPEPRLAQSVDVSMPLVPSDVWTTPIYFRRTDSNNATSLPSIETEAQGIAMLGDEAIARLQNTLKGIAPAPLPASRPPGVVPLAPSDTSTLPSEAATVPIGDAGPLRPTAPASGFYDSPSLPGPSVFTVKLAIVLFVVGIGAAIGYIAVGLLVRGTLTEHPSVGPPMGTSSPYTTLPDSSARTRRGQTRPHLPALPKSLRLSTECRDRIGHRA